MPCSAIPLFEIFLHDASGAMDGVRRTPDLFLSLIHIYHHTATSFVQGLLQNGFVLTDFVEPRPDPSMMDLPGMQDELRRPMMLLLAGRLERR